ncbi:MAG: AAA family ATPase [Acidimicrobiia bacterium]|nr:AAA family ATPase [Acidimicrobiia bacterium]
MIGRRVYKVKKPVHLDFVDLSTVEDRRRMCTREVELNRRLAPDVYLDVADVVGSDGERCDSVVVMQRMPESRRLTTLVGKGDDVDDALRSIARTVAGFHAAATTSAEISAAATAASVRANWEANFSTMAQFVGPVLDPETASRVAGLARRYLSGRESLFDARIAEGRVRDGHGDLLADDIFCLDDGPRILDCIEFDDSLRFGDVLADVAFLAMDLERIGAPALGARFLDWYREFSAETYPASLAHHYIAYRAHVRSKVACLRVGQGDTDAEGQARRLLEICDEHLQRGRVALVLVGGLPGTGKSTLAAGLGDRLGWTVLRSDELRKDLEGIAHSEHRSDEFGAGMYDREHTAATYRTLVDRAGLLLARGESVILDASWSIGRWREAAQQVAEETASDCVEFRCTAPDSVAVRRLEERLAAGDDVSDATAGVARRMALSADAWPTAVTIDTASSPEEAVSAALQCL